MTKYVPKKLTQLSANESAAVDIINQNFDSIKEHIDDALSRTAKAPSQMQAPLDMNGQKIINVSAPTQDTDLVRQKDVVADKEEIKQLVNTASIAVEKAMEAAETAEEAAEDMADQIQLAKDWATKTDGPVADGEYSSKYYAENIGADVHTVADIATDVTAVASNAANINAVASDASNINAVAEDLTNIDAVASDATDIGTVATNISDVSDCANNMAAIQAAPTAAENAAASATAAQEAALSITNGWDLFDRKWEDHLLNDQNWLRADTFSWQDGTVYTEAYNHLVDDIDGKTATSETVGSYTISYYLADDGHKITTDETNVANIYNESGVAWYYILDTTNQRFKLPRENPNREILALKSPVIGNGTCIGIDNGTTGAGLNEGSAGTESNLYLYGKPTGTTPTGPGFSQSGAFGLSKDPTKSGIIADLSEATGVFKGHKYLYFYVGQFTQTATEQTAGLNAELFNGKVDLNAANLSTQGKSLISGLGMPSDTYENLTLGSTGSTYTATDNGWLSLAKASSASGQYVALSDETTGYKNMCIASASGQNAGVVVPVRKNDTITVYYTCAGTVQWFRFIYAEGEESV